MKFSVYYDRATGKVDSYAENDGVTEGELPSALAQLIYPEPIPDFVNIGSGQVNYKVDLETGELVYAKATPKAIK